MTTHHSHDHHSHDHPHDHDHDHPGGLKGVLLSIFRPHSHDTADSIDSELESSAEGIRALKISLVVLLATAVAQLLIFLMTGSTVQAWLGHAGLTTTQRYLHYLGTSADETALHRLNQRGDAGGDADQTLGSIFR
jgi:hypothetical protein